MPARRFPPEEAARCPDRRGEVIIAPSRRRRSALRAKGKERADLRFRHSSPRRLSDALLQPAGARPCPPPLPSRTRGAERVCHGEAGGVGHPGQAAGGPGAPPPGGHQRQPPARRAARLGDPLPGGGGQPALRGPLAHPPAPPGQRSPPGRAGRPRPLALHPGQDPAAVGEEGRARRPEPPVPGRGQARPVRGRQVGEDGAHASRAGRPGGALTSRPPSGFSCPEQPLVSGPVRLAPLPGVC